MNIMYKEPRIKKNEKKACHVCEKERFTTNIIILAVNGKTVPEEEVQVCYKCYVS